MGNREHFRRLRSKQGGEGQREGPGWKEGLLRAVGPRNEHWRGSRSSRLHSGVPVHKPLPLSGHRPVLGTVWGLAIGDLGDLQRVCEGSHAQLNVLLLNKRPVVSFCTRPPVGLGRSIFLPVSSPLEKP